MFLDHARHTVSTRQHELDHRDRTEHTDRTGHTDHTDHTDHPDHPDHPDQESLCPAWQIYFRLRSGNRFISPRRQ